jgi:hypothetical protein
MVYTLDNHLLVLTFIVGQAAHRLVRGDTGVTHLTRGVSPGVHQSDGGLRLPATCIDVALPGLLLAAYFTVYFFSCCFFVRKVSLADVFSLS